MPPTTDTLTRYFFARTDAMAVLASWGKPCPVDAVGIADALIRSHLEGDRAEKVTVPRLDEKGRGQLLTGPFRLGSYAPDCDGNTPWLCIDCDGQGHGRALADPQTAALQMKAILETQGLTVYLEKSGGGRGWHLWILFTAPVAAAKARRLALALIPRDVPLTTGDFANPAQGWGIEVFPKQDHISPDGYGNFVWLPWWYGAKGDANQFHMLNGDGTLHPCMPESFTTIDEAAVDRILAKVVPPTVPAPSPEATPAAPRPHGRNGDDTWQEWRREALAALPLDTVYGEWLTGKTRNHGWLECHDPWSPTGDQHPSAGVADGTGEAERGSFHSFISGRSMSAFDFLIELGRAADFTTACELVADLSGVPTPSQTRPSEPRVVEPQTALVGDSAQPTSVEYVNNRDHVSELFDRVVDAILPADRFFNMNGKLVYVQPGMGLLRVTEANLNGLLSPLVEIAISKQGSESQTFVRYSLLPADFVAPFIWSPLVLERLPGLKQYTRSPVFDTSWVFVATPGYHAEIGIYYDGPRITPVDHTQYLDQILADFCWKSPIDRVNYVGMLLTALTMPHWILGHPLEVFNGNKPGVGKSLLAKIQAILVDGRLPQSIGFNPNDEEFEKQLATRVDEGDRIILIDNAKGNRHVRCVESQVLERAATDPILNFRRLGFNTSITRPNDVIFCLTMNFTQLSRDLRRRHIPVNLEQPASVQEIKYPIVRPEAFVTEHRLEILAELAGMVTRWREAGSPPADNPARHSISQVWAETIDGILRASKLPDFLGNFDESEHAFDPDYDLMVEICDRFHRSSPATAAAWAERLASDLLQTRFTDRQGRPKPPRSQATIVGNLFSQYLDAVLETPSGRFVICCEPSQGNAHSSKVYGFTPVDPLGGQQP